MISLDVNSLDMESSSGKRMLDYAGLVNKLTIILFSIDGDVKSRKNLTVYPTSNNKMISFLKALWVGFCILREEKYDLITVQDPFGASVVGYFLARVFRLPIQIQVHSTFLSPFWRESTKNTIYQMLAKVFVHRATCVRVVSERIKSSLVHVIGVPEHKISVLPMFTDVQYIVNYQPKFDLHEKYPNFDFIVLMVSRLVKQKNIDLAVEAVRELVDRYPKIGVVIVGSGPEEYSLKQKSRELEQHMVFESWTDDPISYYKGADVFLLTSTYEGWARTAIEAMASGTPVLMTDVGLAGEVVKNGVNGIVIPIGNKNEIINELEKLYKNPKERERLGKAGRKTALNLNPQTWEEYLEMYKQDFARCISK